MMTLAPQFSSNRMVREYAEQFYFPAATDYKKRQPDNCFIQATKTDFYL